MRVLFVLISVLLIPIINFAQSASVWPSRLYYNVTPGNYNSQKLRVSNNGTKAETFTITFVNFNSPGSKGKTVFDTASVSAHGMADWLTASPSFFEVAPGETKDVDILLQVPNTPEAQSVRWAAASVKLTKENTGVGERGENVTGMAILPTISFTVHLFQTPPNIAFKEVIVEKLYEIPVTATDSVNVKILRFDVKNTGDAIANCAPYLDMINLKSGEKLTVKGQGFTILPGGLREITIAIPKSTPKGEYNILGIIDYNSETDVAAMEINLVIP